MTKKDSLNILMLLSALESWAYSVGEKKMPDWLVEGIGDAMEKLRKNILEE